MDSDDMIRKAYESILGHDFERAIEWFEEAVREEPDNPDHHYKLSITYARSNKLTSALYHAREAKRLAPDNEKYRLHVKHIVSRWCVTNAEEYFTEDGDVDQALTLLKRAIKLDPLSFEAYLLLGVAYAKRREYDLALEALDGALDLDPHNETAHQLKGEYRKRKETG